MRKSYIPSIGELHAFVSCARLGSASRAAIELGLTQSAVSRSIASLEDRLGVHLFHRIRQRLTLSDAGRAFQRDAGKLLINLNEAAVSVMAFGNHSEVLRLAVLPTFCNVWLLPRLPLFRQIMPNMTFDIAARLGPVDFDNDPFDAAIHRSHMRPANALFRPLMDERLVVVAAPRLVGPNRLLSDEELVELPLLQQATRPSLWLDWFRMSDLDPRSILRGARFEHFEMVISAATAGLGAGLVPEILVEGQLADGRLIALSDRRLQVSTPYSIIFPPRNENNAGFTAFQDWLVGISSKDAPQDTAPGASRSTS